MTRKTWALKPSDLRSLSRAELLLFCARCALRVAPWASFQDETLWREGLDYVTRCAFQERDTSGRSETLSREVASQGAEAYTRLAPDDETLGTCVNYSACTLAAAIEATSLQEGPELKKRVIEVAKQSTSIPAVLAHAGRVSTAPGEDSVDIACLAAWKAIRQDVSAVAENLPALEAAEDRVRVLQECAPLWIGSTPQWVRA